VSITIGRAGVGFENGLVVSSVDTDGDVVVVNGWIRDQGSLADVTALRGQLNGLAGNTDEPVVPVVWSDGDGSINGFYRVGRVSVGSEPRIRLNADSVLPFSVELVAVPGWQAPLFEVLSRGADRVSATSTAAAAVSWSSGPGGLGSGSHDALVSGPVTVQGDGSTAKVWYHDDRLYSAALTYQVNESGFYDGASRVEVDAVGDGSYRSVVGRQIPNLPGRWRLSNDLVRVYPGGFEAAAPPQALDLPGGSGDYASTPDHSSLDIPGSIDIRIRVTSPNFGVKQILAAKWNTAGDNRGWIFTIPTTGRTITFRTSNNGVFDSGLTNIPLPAGVVNGGTYWFRAVFHASVGWYVYWSDAETNDHSEVSWTLLASRTTSPHTSMFMPSAAVTVGRSVLGAPNSEGPFRGKVHAFAVIQGVFGTDVRTGPVFASSTQFTIGAGTGTDPQGKTWTMHGDAAIIDNTTPGAGGAGSGGTSADYAIEVFDPDAGAWQTKVYNVTTGGATPTSLGIAKAVTVLRNSPETCAVRVHTSNQNGVYVDFTIRRGSWVVEGFVANGHTAAGNQQFGFKRRVIEAATVETGGLVATANDADGHKYRIFTPDAHTADTTKGGVYLTTAADQFSFAATTDTHDGTITARGLYWAAVNHRQQVVAR
jgi:hypothetical protein